MALSHWDPDSRDARMSAVAPTYERRRRSGLLTAYGWFIVLSVLSLVMGAVLAFVT